MDSVTPLWFGWDFTPAAPLRSGEENEEYAFHFMHIFNQVSGPVLQLWAQLSDDSCWQIVLHHSPIVALVPDRHPPHTHMHAATLFSSPPEWIWGLTQQCKTNNTSARTSVFKPTSQLTFELTVVHQLGISSASSGVPCPCKPQHQCPGVFVSRTSGSDLTFSEGL